LLTLTVPIWRDRTGGPFATEPEPVQAAQDEQLLKALGKGAQEVKTEYHRIAICSTRTRPKRSASAPANQPPKDEVTAVTVPIVPAAPVDIPHTAMTVGTT
jgi:hypothetical protein